MLAEFDGLKEAAELGNFLKRHSEEELISFIEGFPFSELKPDWAAVEKDFRNCSRMENILLLASMLVNWKEYRADHRWQGLLPDALDTPGLYNRLSSKLFPFLEGQMGCDIAMVLRARLYDFAMILIQEDRNREAMICLEVSRPSPKEDHDFWLCACYHNIGKLEKDPEVIRRGVILAQEMMSGESKVPNGVIQKMKQTDLLGKLKQMESDIRATPTVDVRGEAGKNEGAPCEAHAEIADSDAMPKLKAGASEPQTVEIEATSLNEAQELLEKKVPEGLAVLSRQILSDGKPVTLEAIADTEQDALADCRKRLPENAVVVDKKVDAKSSTRTLVFQADDEESARENAKTKMSDADTIKNLRVRDPGSKGFLGIGKKPRIYEVEISQPAGVHVQITATTEKVRIRATLGVKPRAKCDMCGEHFDEDKLVPIQLAEAGSGKRSRDLNVCFDCNFKVAQRAMGMFSEPM